MNRSKTTTDQTIFVDGAQSATQANALALIAGSTSQYIVGANNDSNGLSADVDFAEIIIYNRALSDDERNSVGSALAEKYGIATEYVDPIPEPSSVILAAFGLLTLLGFGGRRWRDRK